jgi:hypothetical protein
MVTKPAATPRPTARASEADRLSRPQPPAVIPPRGSTLPAQTPGLLAYTLLGAQVIK